MSATAGATGPAGAQAFKLTVRDVRFTAQTELADDLLHIKATMTGSGAFGDARFDRIEMEASLRRLYAPSYQKVMSSLMGASCDAQAIFSSTSTR